MTRPDRPKRILMLLENSGIPEDTRVCAEAEALAQEGFDVTVICPTRRSRKLWDTLGRIRIYRYPAIFEGSGFLHYVLEYGYSLFMLSVVSLYVFVRRGFDAVHVHTPPDMTAMIAIFYQMLGKKFVFDTHDLSPELYLARRIDPRPNSVYKVLLFFERMACRHADRLISTNETQRCVQIDRGSAASDKCVIVRNGPAELFLTDVKPLNKPQWQDRIVLGFVGVIGVQDGVDYLVRVVHELKTKYHRTDLIAVIVGSGEMLDGLKKLADELQVSDLVEFTGPIPFASVPSYIASFDICLTPDPSNPYNDSCTTIKTMEYMALRKPTVCFRTLENEVTAGEAALYADNNDISMFAEHVIRLMDDPSLRASMGEIARQRIDERFAWRYQAKQLTDLYQELLR